MAKRNPYIPSERAQEMQDRTRIEEEESRQLHAQKQAKLEKKAATLLPVASDDETPAGDETPSAP